MRIGFQMINLRAHSDFERAVNLAAEYGYELAEPFGWKPPVSCVEQHKMAEAAGLKVCSGHYNPTADTVAPYVGELADMLRKAGARAWVMPGGFTGDTEEKMREGAARLREFYAKELKPRGLNVEYHNHSTDVVPMFGEKSQVDMLLELVPELGFQPDIGNAYMGGVTDTIGFMKRYGKRITCLHVKDIRKDHAEIERGHGNLATGDGVVDIAAAVELAKSFGVEDIIIEQEGAEEDSAIEEMMRRSYEFVSSLV